MRVFVFEDDKDILDLIEILLIDLGHEVQGSADATNVIEEIEFFSPNLLILDYWIKGQKADVLINTLRNDSKFRNTPIILVSAIDKLEEVAKSLRVDDIIKKPFDITSFQEKVQKHLNSTYDKTSSNN